jgi:hypothetical protein
MKNLHYHKKQLRQHRARNAFNAWADTELNKISARVREASNKRWDKLQDDLQQQHWELDIRIQPEAHPLEVTMSFIRRTAMLATLQ